MNPGLLLLLSLTAGEAEIEPPSMELLLHLGRFQTADGEWLDPMIIQDLETEQPTPGENHDEDPATDPEPAADDDTGERP